MTTRIARIRWRTPEQGGRRVLPSGPRYSTPARFLVAADQSSCGEWSLVVDLVSRPEATNDWIAEVRFLADEAPHDWLAEGARFELYEGRTCVAQGTVLAATAKGESTLTEAGTPASFDVLTNEIRGLALNMQLEKKRI